MKITEKQLKEDFSLFVVYVWSLLGLPAPTRVQLLICKFMADSSHPAKIIQAFRGVGKSYIAYAFVVWKLWQDPDLKFLVVSASKNRADNFSITCQQFLAMIPQTRHLVPNDRDTVYTKVKWNVRGAKPSGSPSVMSVGIESNFTGSRADIIIADDVESEKNSNTVDQREKLKARVAEFEAIKKGNEGDGNISEILYLGTPQTEESLYTFLTETGYKTRIWTARYPTVDKIADYKGCLCPVLEDEVYTDPELAEIPTDPKRFTDADLIERALRYGKAGWALQFMLDTSLSDAERYPLRTADLIVFNPAPTKAPQQMSHAKTRESTLNDLPRVGFSADRWHKPIFVDTEYRPYERIVMSIDPSGRGGDETGYCVIKMLMGTMYVTRAGGLEGGYDTDQVLKPLAMIAREEGVQEIVIESNFGDGMFTQMLKPVVHAVHPCVFEEVSNHIQKERRIIDTLEPVMARHRLVVTPEVIEQDYATAQAIGMEGNKTREQYSLFYQMTRITKDKGSLNHDDRLDALAICVGYFTERLARDVTKEVNAHKDRLLGITLKKKYDRNLTKNKKTVVYGKVFRSSSTPTLLNF